MRGSALRFSPAARTLCKPARAGCGIDTADRINGGLTGCWLFNEGSGSVLFDLLGSNHGIATALTFSLGQFGAVGAFNGSTSVVLVSAIPVMGSPWTISGWVKWTTLTANSGAFGFDDGTNGPCIGTTAANLKILTNSESPGNGTTALSTGKWYHLALAWDGTKLNAYLNGAFEYNVTPSGSLWKNATRTQFGKSGHSGGTFTTGSLDIIRLHSRSLQRGEIARLYGEPFAGILTLRRRLGRVGAAAAGGSVLSRYYYDMIQAA